VSKTTKIYNFFKKWRRRHRPDKDRIAREVYFAIRQKAAYGAQDARDWTGAVTLLRSVLTEVPESASANAIAGLATAHRELGELDEAEEVCAGGIALFPRHAGLATEAAEVAALRRDWTRAVAAWRPISPQDRGLSRVSRKIAGTLYRMLEDDSLDMFLEHREAGTRGLSERFRLALEGIFQLRSENWPAADKIWDRYWAMMLSGAFSVDASPIPIRDRPSAQNRFRLVEPRKIKTYGTLDRRVCIYTALFGEHDWLRSPAYIPDGVDFLCFSDRPRRASGWKVIIRDPGMGNPALDNRRLKILPFDELQAYDASLYVDANTLFLGDPLLLFQRWLEGSPFVAWRHPERSDIYAECEAILVSSRHEPRAILDCYRRLRAESFPPRDGLFELSALFRSHSDTKVEAFCQEWWKTFQDFPKRDQLSFPYVIRRTGIAPNTLPDRLGTSRTNDQFVKIYHGRKIAPNPPPTRRTGISAITNLVFVYHSTRRDIVSTIMRGRQLSEIARRSLPDTWSVHYVDEQQVDEIRNAFIILNKGFCKTTSPEMIARLKRQGNLVSVDYVDDPVEPAIAEVADLLISSSLRQHEALLREHREVGLITHHVDPGIAGIRAQTDHLSLGYFGLLSNTLYDQQLKDDIEFCAINFARLDTSWINRLQYANAHYALRSRKPYDGFKPFLKGFTAAHCGANILVNRLEGDAVYYLSADYPYLLEDDSIEGVFAMIERMRESFGSAEWLEGLEIMKSVQARSSHEQIGQEIRALLKQAVG